MLYSAHNSNNDDNYAPRSVKHILAPALILAKITRYDRSPKDFDASLRQLVNILPCLRVLSVIVGLVRVLGSGRRL